ncbi:UNKNOWN [Stylonychia lemnae]|uniref:Uncharacterized protein n=1 Tax=Stylonychia lemnae TaxID=5949 RepID=A0A078A2Q2_STYLE|nr:UNKNOWN [Stylonychia lemnae]|eukprot:CDW76548.1 UNKNOWN [Stylonychia lemnae]
MYSLQNGKQMKEISGVMKFSSIFFKDNYIQIHSEQGTNILFFKNKNVDKIIQIQQIHNFNNQEMIESYQRGFNQKSCSVFKRKEQDQKVEVYTMTQNINSFQELFGEEHLIQPVYPAFHFDLAYKIIIDSSAVKIYIKGEQQQVGYFDIDITDQTIKDFRIIIGQSNEEIILELTQNVNKYLKFVAGFGTVFGLFQNNLIALEILLKQKCLVGKAHWTFQLKIINKRSLI